MEEIKIEKGITPVQTSKRFPFAKMVVGDSFYVPLANRQKISSLAAQLCSNAKSYVLMNKLDWIFKTQRDSGGVRVWRVK